MSIYKKNLWTVTQSVRLHQGRWQTLLFSSKQWSGLTWSGLVVFFIPEQLISWSGQCWGGGGGWGVEDRDWTTDGDGWRWGSQSASGRGEQTLRWNQAGPACRRRRGTRGGPSQPCLPRGPPCLRRHEPSRVSNAIFTNAWKLLLLSLRLSCEGTQTQTDSFAGDAAHHSTSINHPLAARLRPAQISRLCHRLFQLSPGQRGGVMQMFTSLLLVVISFLITFLRLLFRTLRLLWDWSKI